MQTRKNQFKAAIRAGTPQIGIWSSLCSNIVADLLSTVGFDWALIDMEHSPNSLETVLSQMQAYLGSDTTPVVRPPWNEPVIIKRLLDLGASSLLLPMVQTAEEAANAVRSCRYPPRGIRGVSLSQRANRFGGAADYLERAEAEICVLVQIETTSALERVEEIAAVDGVDGVFFGPADLSADMGYIGQPNHEAVAAAIGEGSGRVRKAGKPTGILVGTPDLARRWLDEGITFVACGSDQNLLAGAARGVFASIAERRS